MGGVDVAVKLNKSARFLLPLVAGKTLYTSSFINSYIELPNIIVVLAKTKNEDLNNNRYLIESGELNTGENYYKLQIPEQHQKDFDSFITGKYSKFSMLAKEIVCNVNRGRRGPEETDWYKILFKTPDRKQELEELLAVKLPHDAELLSIPNMDEELFDGERIKI